MRRPTPEKHDHAKALRAKSTNAEKQLWNVLKNRKLCGLKFRRQMNLGPYIVDFVCHELKLVVEVDGPTHTDRGEYDQKRTHYLQKQGFKVIRFANHQIYEALFGVQREIAKACGLVFPPPEPVRSPTNPSP